MFTPRNSEAIVSCVIHMIEVYTCIAMHDESRSVYYT